MIAGCTEVLGSNHEYTIQAKQNHAITLCGLEEYEEASELEEEVITWCRLVLGTYHEDTL